MTDTAARISITNLPRAKQKVDAFHEIPHLDNGDAANIPSEKDQQL
jgi:hypothetical protein